MQRLVNGLLESMTAAEIDAFEASRRPTQLRRHFTPRALIRVFRDWEIAAALFEGMDDVGYAEFLAAGQMAEDDAVIAQALALAGRSIEDLASAVAAG